MTQADVPRQTITISSDHRTNLLYVKLQEPQQRTLETSELVLWKRSVS